MQALAREGPWASGVEALRAGTLKGTEGQRIRRLGSPLAVGVSLLVLLTPAAVPFGNGYAMVAWGFGLGLLVMAVAVLLPLALSSRRFHGER